MLALSQILDLPPRVERLDSEWVANISSKHIDRNTILICALICVVGMPSCCASCAKNETSWAGTKSRNCVTLPADLDESRCEELLKLVAGRCSNCFLRKKKPGRCYPQGDRMECDVIPEKHGETPSQAASRQNPPSQPEEPTPLPALIIGRSRSGSMPRKASDATTSVPGKATITNSSQPSLNQPRAGSISGLGQAESQSPEARKDGRPVFKMRRTGHVQTHLRATSKDSSHEPAHRPTPDGGAGTDKKQDEEPLAGASGLYQHVVDYALQQSTKLSTSEQASFLTGAKYAFDTASRMSALDTAAQDISMIQGRVLDLLKVFLTPSSTPSLSISTTAGSSTQPANTPLFPWELAPGSSRATEPDADGNKGQVFFSQPLIERDQISLGAAYQIGRHKKVESKPVHSGHSLTVEADQDWERDCVVTAGRVKVSVQGGQQQLGHQSVFLINRGVGCRIENTHREVASITIIWREVAGYR